MRISAPMLISKVFCHRLLPEAALGSYRREIAMDCKTIEDQCAVAVAREPLCSEALTVPSLLLRRVVNLSDDTRAVYT